MDPQPHVKPDRSLAQRRQVTVLFLDVVGSTALSQGLDPEDVQDVMDGVLARCTRVVRAHGGQVLQYAGDSLLAVFGAEPAAEGDAAHAVRCALALREQGEWLQQAMQAQHGHAGCHVRVGLHTGVVLLSGGIDEAGPIRGFAVNIAARMEQTAPAGAVRISHDTWLLVRHRFATEPQPPLKVKGSDELLRTHLVLNERSPDFHATPRGLDLLQSPLIGRDSQRRQLEALLAHVLRTRCPQGATLQGQPGVGKSRLLMEWRAALQADNHHLLLARAHPTSRQEPYSLLRELVHRALGIADSSSASAACRQLLDGLVPTLGSDGLAQAQRLGQLLGLPFGDAPALRGLEPSRLRALAFDALQTWLQSRVPANACLVLLVEDLHWSDDDSLDFLAALLRSPPGAAMLLVATARPELRLRRPTWPEADGAAATHQWIDLLELPANDCDRLAQALLAPLPQPEPELHRLLIERSDGNPFFMEELLRMLLDHGVISNEDGPWRVFPARLQQTRLPTTLVEVLQARLDALPPAQRQALQLASIIGPVFWHATLSAMDEAAPAALPDLQRRGLVDEHERSSFEGTAEDAFHHQLQQQVTYDSVLKATRRLGHARVAHWLADNIGERAGEHLASTAEHFERAGDNAEASLWYERAARTAHERNAHAAALGLAQAALRTADPADLRRLWRLHDACNNAADPAALRDVQAAALAECSRIAEQLADDQLRAETCFLRAVLASRTGHETEALALAQQAVALGAGGLAPRVSALAQVQMAWSCHTQGHQQQALQHADAAIAEARRALRSQASDAVELALGKALAMHAIVLSVCGHVSQARADADEALLIAERHGIARLKLSALEVLAGIDHETGQLHAALRSHQRLAQAARALQMPTYFIVADLNTAHTLWSLGRHEEARTLTQTATSEARAHAAHDFLGQLQGLAALLAHETGRIDEATELASASEATFVTLDSPAFICQARAQRALLALAAGDAPLALALSESVWQAIHSGIDLHGITFPALPGLACHRVFLHAGDARARAAIEQAHALVQQIAQRSGDPQVRDAVLNSQPLHREVVQAWRDQQA